MSSPILPGAPLRRRLFLAAGALASIYALTACAEDDDEDNPLHDTTLPPSGAMTALPTGTALPTLPAPPSETALPLEFSQTPTWPPRKDTAVISRLVGRYVVFATSPKSYKERDTYVTGVAAVDGSAGWLLVVDPDSGEVSTVQIPADGEPELPEPADDSHPGQALRVLAADFDEANAYALISVAKVPVGSNTRTARIDLLKIELASGKISGTLPVSTDVEAPREDSCYLDLMSNGSLSAHVSFEDTSVALVVDPSSMTKTMDPGEKLGADETTGIKRLGPEAMGVMGSDADGAYPSWKVLLLTDGTVKTLEAKLDPAQVHQDWAYVVDERSGVRDAPTVMLNVRTDEQRDLSSPLLGDKGNFTMSSYWFDDGVLIGKQDHDHQSRKEDDTTFTNGEVRLPGEPGALISLEALQEAHADLPAVFGGLLWARTTQAGKKDQIGVVCFDAATGDKLGTIAADDTYGKPLEIQDVSSWGIVDTTAFYPATSWAKDVAAWKEKKA